MVADVFGTVFIYAVDMATGKHLVLPPSDPAYHLISNQQHCMGKVVFPRLY